MQKPEWTMSWKAVIHLKFFANLKIEMKQIHSLKKTILHQKKKWK